MVYIVNLNPLIHLQVTDYSYHGTLSRTFFRCNYPFPLFRISTF